MIQGLIRFSMVAALFAFVSNTGVHKAMDQLHSLTGQAQAAVASSEKQPHTESLRPAEVKAIGTYLETPTLGEVYPGLTQLGSIR